VPTTLEQIPTLSNRIKDGCRNNFFCRINVQKYLSQRNNFDQSEKREGAFLEIMFIKVQKYIE
jgi:hypothetical protein